MPANSIPFDIQSEIIKRLLVKSLLQFRSVSKSYKSLIHSSDFIANYTSQNQHQHLLIRYKDVLNYFYSYNYVSVVDDGDTFPTQRVSLTLPKLVEYGEVIGSSHGLFCFYNPPWLDSPTSGTARVLIFNPCIRKTLAFVVPRVTHDHTRQTVLGFGVCRETTEPKIVKVTFSGIASVYIPWEVEVFTLSTRAWRSPYSTNLPSRYIYIFELVVLDGFLYWLACDRLHFYKFIISFDMTSEEFREVNLPDSLSYGHGIVSMYKLGGSLAVINHGLVFDVWTMVDDDPKCFKKLYTISRYSPDASIFSVRGFRKTGEPLLEVILQAQHGSTRTLAAYDPYSKSIISLGINIRPSSSLVYSYMETLLLL